MPAGDSALPSVGSSLNQHSLGTIAAAAVHIRDEHRANAAARYYFAEDAWQCIPVDFNFTTVDDRAIPVAGQLDLFDTNR